MNRPSAPGARGTVCAPLRLRPAGAEPARPQTPLAPPRMDPVRKWVLIFAAFCMVLLAWYMAADRYTPFTTQARVNAFVVPIAPQVAGEILSVDVRTNQVFVTDIPSKLEEIAAVIAKIDIPVRQVLIEARIVEAVDSFGQALGVKLGYADLRGAPTSAGANVGGNYDAIGAQTGQTAGPIDFANSQFINLPANTSNLGGASAADIEAVIEKVEEVVEAKTNVRLIREVRIIGDRK